MKAPWAWARDRYEVMLKESLQRIDEDRQRLRDESLVRARKWNGKRGPICALAGSAVLLLFVTIVEAKGIVYWIPFGIFWCADVWLMRTSKTIEYWRAATDKEIAKGQKQDAEDARYKAELAGWQTEHDVYEANREFNKTHPRCQFCNVVLDGINTVHAPNCWIGGVVNEILAKLAMCAEADARRIV